MLSLSSPIDGEAVSTLTSNLDKDGIPVVAIDRQVSGKSIATVELTTTKSVWNSEKCISNPWATSKRKVLIVGGPLSSSATVNRTAL